LKQSTLYLIIGSSLIVGSGAFYFIFRGKGKSRLEKGKA